MIAIKNHKLAIVSVGGLAILLIACFFVWRYRSEILAVDIQLWVDKFASFGPVPFFFAMAILPCFWIPVSPFLLFAGAVYSLPVAIIGCGVSLSANMALSWLVAGIWFRPLFERLVHRFGHSVPKLENKDMLQIAVLLRITPGMPFPLQNYLLGLARMPFGWYMLVSVPLNLLMAISIVIFGEAIIKGNVMLALLAVSLFLVITLAIRILRNRLRRNRIESELV